MRGHSWFAGVAAGASAFGVAALLAWPAYAANAPAHTAAANQWANPDLAPAADPSDTAPATPSDTGPAAPPATGEAVQAPQETAPPPEATPVVASIRAKLAEMGKTLPSADLAALEAFYNTRGDPLWMTDMGFSAYALAAIDEMRRADDWGLSSAAFDLPPAGNLPKSPDEAAANEIKLDLAILKYARFARGGRTDPVKLDKLFGVSPTLPDPNKVMSGISASDAPDAYLRSLQPKHEQFQRLHQALLKVRETGKGANTQKIIVNMERWRWMPEDLGSLYLWLNIPEFNVYVVKDGKSIYSDKIVVGELRYATPMFSADLKSVVFNPEWTVPPTIVRENLLPNLRGGGGLFSSNTSILTQHELKVKYNGRFVDPGSINWNTVNMTAISFVQAPGPNNVLGKVKFVYPNPFSVYMHDTIKQGLFDTDMRAEGHNCPRVFKPGKMAAVVLAADQDMPQAQVDKLLAEGSNTFVNIQHHFPVHTTYFTVTVDDQGNLKTYADIYKLDAVVAAAIGARAATTEAVADNVPQAKTKPQTPGGDIADSVR